MCLLSYTAGETMPTLVNIQATAMMMSDLCCDICVCSLSLSAVLVVEEQALLLVLTLQEPC